MAARPGNRRYNAELNIQLGMKGIDPAKKGVNSISDAISKAVFGVNQFNDSASLMDVSLRRMTAESNGYLTSIKEISSQFDYYHKLATSFGDGNPLDFDVKTIVDYQQYMSSIKNLLDEIGEMGDPKEFGITDASVDKLEAYLKDFKGLSNEYSDVVDSMRDFAAFKEDLAILGKALDPILSGLQGVSGEFDSIVGSITGASDEAKAFFGILKKGYNSVAKALKPVSDSLKEMAGSAIKDKMSKYLYGKLQPAVGASGKSVKSLVGAADDLAPALNGATTSATATSGALTATSTGASSAGASMSGASASAGGMAAAMGPVAVVAAVVIAVLAALVVVLAAIKHGLDSNIKTMEKFRETGYRAMGSIRDLTDATYELSKSTGLSNDESIRVIDSLAKAGFAFDTLGETVTTTSGAVLKGRQAMDRLAKTNAMFTKATGASATATAMLQKRLTASSITIDKQEALFGDLSNSARKYGLQGDDLTGVVNGLKDQSILLTKVLDKTDFGAYADGYAAMAGAARKLGLSMDVVHKAMKGIADADDASMSLAAFGGSLDAYFSNDASKRLEATAAGAKAVLEQANQFEGVVKQRFLEKFGGYEQLQAMVTAQAELNSLTGAQKDELKKVEASRAALASNYKESLGTITQSLQQIATPILALFAQVVGPVADALVKFFADVDIKKFGDGMGQAIKFVMEMFEPLGGLFKDVYSTLSELFEAMGEFLGPMMPMLVQIGKFLINFIVVPIRLVLVAVRLVIASFKLVSGVIMSVLKPVFYLVGLILEWVNGLTDYFDEIDKAFSEIYKGIEWVLKPLRAMWDAFATIRDIVLIVKGALFGSSMFHIKESVAEDIGPALKIFKFLLTALLSPIDLIISAAGKIFKIFKAVPAALGAASDGVSSLASEAWTGMSNVATSAYDTVSSIAGSVTDKIGDATGWVGNKLSKLGQSAISTAAAVSSAVSNFFKFGDKDIKKAIKVVKVNEAVPAKAVMPKEIQKEANGKVIDSDTHNAHIKAAKGNFAQPIMGSFYGDNGHIKLAAQMAEDTAATKATLEKMLERQNDDTPAQLEAADRLRKIADKEDIQDYQNLNSGFGERTNQWWP